MEIRSKWIMYLLEGFMRPIQSVLDWPAYTLNKGLNEEHVEYTKHVKRVGQLPDM